MKKMCALFVVLACTALLAWAQDPQAKDATRVVELDDYWAEVSRCVKEGDFEGFKATFHQDGIFVSGPKNEAYHVSQALKRWKPDFTHTKSGMITAGVEFRFSQRLGNETTAHETGMFCYSRVNADGTKAMYYVHLEALLIKRGTWKLMMEYQKSQGTEEEWKKLKSSANLASSAPVRVKGVSHFP